MFILYTLNKCFSPFTDLYFFPGACLSVGSFSKVLQVAYFLNHSCLYSECFISLLMHRMQVDNQFSHNKDIIPWQSDLCFAPRSLFSVELSFLYHKIACSLSLLDQYSIYFDVLLCHTLFYISSFRSLYSSLIER
jgi:hypothetical protein